MGRLLSPKKRKVPKKHLHESIEIVSIDNGAGNDNNEEEYINTGDTKCVMDLKKNIYRWVQDHEKFFLRDPKVYNFIEEIIGGPICNIDTNDNLGNCSDIWENGDW